MNIKEIMLFLMFMFIFIVGIAFSLGTAIHIFDWMEVKDCIK